MEQDIASGNLSDDEIFEKYDYLMWDYCYRGDIEKTFYYANKAITLAREKKNVKEEAMFLTSIGDIYSMLGVKDTAFIYIDKALKILEGKEYYREESGNYKTRGNVYYEFGEHENAMDAYLKAIELNEKDRKQRIANKQDIDKNFRDEVSLLNNISNIYGQMYNPDKQIEYLARAIRLMDDNPDVDFKRNAYSIPGNLAAAYMNVEQYDKALPLLEKAYQKATAKGDISSMVFNLVQFARYYGQCENWKQAINYAKQALQIAEKVDMTHAIAWAEDYLMAAYLSMNDYKTALYYADRLLSKTPDEDWVHLQRIYTNTSLIYAGMGKMEQALQYRNKAQELTTKISDENLHSALQEMEVKYEVEQKEQAHQAELKRKQTLQYILVGGLTLTVLLISLLMYIVTLRNKRNRELAETNATKDKFFSIISHDLKNPAISQRDALQLLLDNSDKWDKDALANYYGKLLKSADSQVILLYNLLNWAYLQTGKMPFVANPFNLKAALKSDIDLIQNMAEQKGITFKINTSEEPTVTGDDNMLLIIIRNLLTNAVKFTPTGGTITLDISQSCTGVLHTPTEKTGVARNATTIVSISDTGTGMTIEQLHNLFKLDAINRVSTRGTAGEQGSGLGLIVCKELVEKHGTSLNVESEEGMGSRFWFEI
jgi:signal transduction histidine kinase